MRCGPCPGAGNGLDESGRIRNAQGKRPVIKNVSPEHVEVFRRQVWVVDLIGTTDIEAIAEQVAQAAANDPGPAEEIFPDTAQVPVQQAAEPTRLVSDPAGYLVLYPDRRRRLLVLEHFANNGVITGVIEGTTPAALYGAVIAEGLVSRLEHAAYLGRELARAETALRTGDAYVQDRASGDEEAAAPTGKSCSCGRVCAAGQTEQPHYRGK